MLFKIPVNISVICVCGEKLSAVIVDSAEYDVAIVVDNEHKCPAAELKPAGARFELVRVYDESEVEEVGVGDYRLKDTGEGFGPLGNRPAR